MKKPQMLFKFKALDFIEKNAIYEAAYTFKNATSEISLERPIIIICIGSDKNISDGFGPMVGTFLIENNFPYKVYGTLQNPVNAFNLEDTINKIIKHYANPFIIGIDASLGEPAKIGYIQLNNGPIYPGLVFLVQDLLFIYLLKMQKVQLPLSSTQLVHRLTLSYGVESNSRYP